MHKSALKHKIKEKYPTVNQTEEKLQILIPEKAVSINHAYPQNRFGRRYLSEEGKTLKEIINWSLKHRILWTPLKTDKYNVFIRFIFKDKRRRDVDDYFKIVLDGLTEAGVWQDDSQIEMLVGIKESGAEDQISITTYRNPAV